MEGLVIASECNQEGMFCFLLSMFGFMDYQRPGKGVDKHTPPKKKFFLFWELYFRKLWKLMMLNAVFLLFCLPIVTIAPAVSALMYILKQYAAQRPVFLWTEFVQAFRQNWKKSVLMGSITTVTLCILSVSWQYYGQLIATHPIFYLPLLLTGSLMFVVIMASAYMFVMIPFLDIQFMPMLKNAVILVFLGITTNMITAVIILGVLFICYLLFPISLLFLILLFFSTVCFIVVFNLYPKVEQYIIIPYYQRIGKPHPDTVMYEQAPICQDAAQKQTSTPSKGQDESL